MPVLGVGFVFVVCVCERLELDGGVLDVEVGVKAALQLVEHRPEVDLVET